MKGTRQIVQGALTDAAGALATTASVAAGAAAMLATHGALVYGLLCIFKNLPLKFILSSLSSQMWSVFDAARANIQDSTHADSKNVGKDKEIAAVELQSVLETLSARRRRAAYEADLRYRYGHTSHFTLLDGLLTLAHVVPSAAILILIYKMYTTITGTGKSLMDMGQTVVNGARDIAKTGVNMVQNVPGQIWEQTGAPAVNALAESQARNFDEAVRSNINNYREMSPISDHSINMLSKRHSEISTLSNDQMWRHST